MGSKPYFEPVIPDVGLQLVPAYSLLALGCLPHFHPSAKREQESIHSTTIVINAGREHTQVIWQSNTVGGNTACTYPRYISGNCY
jgi:hypothetical protein